MARPATADHLRSKKKRATKVIEVVLDPDAAQAVRDAEWKVDEAEARLRLSPDDENAQAAVWAAKEELGGLRAQAATDDAVVTLRFRAIGHVAYDELVRAHPPVADQIVEAKAAGGDLNYNAYTFPPAVVAASLEEPKMTLAEVAELWESPDWNLAELSALFSAAVEVNSRRVTLDLGKDSSGTAPTAPKSDGAPTVASPTASS
ncbi:MAG: hypothetical protein QOD57_2607 [Actinomycetota bacterium]|jgi:hypothetical protein|nr:hypothetical protein [Actinomycetota bacterium]